MQICGDWPCVLEWFDRSGSTIIALCALAVSITTVLYTRYNARITALPHLHLHHGFDFAPVHATGGFYGLAATFVTKLINGGSGPGIITRYEAFADGAPFDLNDNAQTTAVLSKVFGVETKATWYYVEEGCVAIPKDGVIPALSFQCKVPNLEALGQVQLQIRRLRIRVEYQSLYGDKLLFDSDVPAPAPNLDLIRLKRRPRGS